MQPSSSFAAFLKLILVCLGTVAIIGPIMADTQDTCLPADRHAPGISPIDCFVASVQHDNVITLRWRVRDAESLVYIYDEQPPAYRDPGYQRPYCIEEPFGVCSLRLTRSESGFYRWTLSSKSRDGTFTASTALDLPPVEPPTVSGGGFVDALRPRDQQLRWSAAAPRKDVAYWVEVKEPGIKGWLKKRFAATGSEAVHDIPADFFRQDGEQAFAVRTCFTPPSSSAKLCSPPVPVAYNVGHDYFRGTRNRHIASAQPLRLEFTERSGDVRLLTLVGPRDVGTVIDTRIANSGVEISADRLPPGRYFATLNSCTFPEGICSNREPAALAQQDGIFLPKPPGNYQAGESIGVLTSTENSDRLEVRTGLSGEIQFVGELGERRVSAGDVLAHRVDGYGDILHIHVGPDDEWITGRPYRLDFHPGVAASSLGMGQPLDIAFDANGGIWMLNEFSNGVEHLSADGGVSTIGAPLARTAAVQDAFREGEARRAVRPFNIAWQPGLATRSTISPLAEKLVFIDDKLWFTQGGALAVPGHGDAPNASRVIMFDPSITDATDTAKDERFCVYNMPVDADAPRGNQQVIGITAAAGRIWVAETRGITSGARSHLSSFVPTRSACKNWLDFEDPAALASQPLRYCTASRTPEQDGCIETVPLPETHRSIKIAHLEADPDGEAIWFTDASGQVLGRYDVSGEGGFTLHALRETHYGEHDTIAHLGGFLWDLEVTDNAVYAAEYASRHILRFDKQRKRFDEISIPYEGRRMRLHSMVIDKMRERLWFTLANECAAPSANVHSTIGYVDLDSWEDHLTSPNNRKVRGVVYKGLEDIPQCERRPGTHQSFRGIALEEHTGRLALATMYRGQFTLLTPLPGFWP